MKNSDHVANHEAEKFIYLFHKTFKEHHDNKDKGFDSQDGIKFTFKKKTAKTNQKHSKLPCAS